MNKLELEFRKDLLKTMSGVWVPTVHVENHLNPGVPDLSYVMTKPGHETGWLELKAIDAPRTSSYRFHLEPSQHRWIDAHHLRVPVHLLLAAGRVAWLVPGGFHRLFVDSVTLERLNEIGVGFQIEQTRAVLFQQLTKATYRGRT